MINSFIGMLGKNKGTKVNHSFTNSESIAMALFVDGKIRNYNYSNESNLILMKNEREYEIHENYRNIYHDVLIDTIFNLYDMFKIATGGNLESYKLNPKAPTLIAYKTDSITVANALDVPLSTEIGGYKLEKVKLGEKKVKNTIQDSNTNFEYSHRPIFKKFSGYGSFLITGKAGRGKTYVIANEVIPKLNELKEQWFALGFSHQVKKNLNSYPIMENRAMTIASFFENAQKCPGIFWNNIKTKINDRTWIIVDEIFAVSKEDICLLYRLFYETKCRFVLVGDSNQLAGIDRNPVNYENVEIIHEMCPNKIVLTEKYRFDDELDEFSEKINKGIPISMNQVITKPLRVNLAYTHNTRLAVNNLCMEHFDKSKIQYLEIPYVKKAFETGNIAQTVYPDYC
jgi:hypothetical protein